MECLLLEYRVLDGRLVVYSSPTDTDTNCFLAYTPTRPDFTSLGSFGNIDYVAATIVPSGALQTAECTIAALRPLCWSRRKF